MPEDFHGKKVASPQFGNTQDIDLRDWLSKHGLKPRERGGDVQITPIANTDQHLVSPEAGFDPDKPIRGFNSKQLKLNDLTGGEGGIRTPGTR